MGAISMFFGYRYYLERTAPQAPKMSIPKPSTLPPVKVVHDTIKVPIAYPIYIDKHLVIHDTIIKYDTVLVDRERFQTTFYYNPPEFDMTILCWAECVTDSVTAIHKMREDYINSLLATRRTIEPKWWEKWTYLGAGLVGGYVLGGF